MLLIITIPLVRESSAQENVFSHNGYATVNLKRVIDNLHTETINDIEYDPKHDYFITCSDDESAGIFDFTTGENIDYLYEYYNDVRDIALNSNYTLLATADNDGFIMTYKYPEIVKLKMIYAHNYSVSSVIFTYDNSRLISAGDDGLVKIWDVNDNFNIIKIIEAHNNYITKLSCDRWAHFLITASEDKTLKVFDLNSYQLLHTLKGHIDYIRGASISPNGEYIVSGDDSGMIIIWETSTGRVIHKLTHHDDIIRDINITPDGKGFVACSDDRTVSYWDLQTGDLIRVYEGLSDWVYSVDFKTDLEYIITVNDDYRAEVLPFSIDGFKKAIGDSNFGSNEQNKHNSVLSQINKLSVFDNIIQDPTAVSYNDKDKILALSFANGDISLFNVNRNNLNEMGSIDAHDAYINLLKLSPDGRLIISSSYDGSIQIRGINGKILQVIESKRRVNNLIVSSDSRFLVFSDISPSLYIWDMKNKVFTLKKSLHNQISHISFSEDNNTLLICLINGEIISYDVSKNEWGVKTDTPYPVRNLISYNDKLIISDGTSDLRMISLSNVSEKTGQNFLFYSKIKITGKIYNPDKIKDGYDKNIKYFFSLDEYGIIIFWNVMKNGILPVKKLKISQSKIKHAVYSIQSGKLLVITDDNILLTFRIL